MEQRAWQLRGRHEVGEGSGGNRSKVTATGRAALPLHRHRHLHQRILVPDASTKAVKGIMYHEVSASLSRDLRPKAVTANRSYVQK